MKLTKCSDENGGGGDLVDPGWSRKPLFSQSDIKLKPKDKKVLDSYLSKSNFCGLDSARWGTSESPLNYKKNGEKGVGKR